MVEFFFYRIYIRFIEILAESTLYWDVPSNQQIICTYLLFIPQSLPNHSKSQTSYYSRVQT